MTAPNPRSTPLPPAAYRQFTPDLRICRTLNGMWQVSGAHGRIDPHAALDAMLRYHDAGFTTWDLADHYGPAEDLISAFRQRLSEQRGDAEVQRVQAFTKWVPRPTRITRQMVADAVNISLRRMGVPTLDLLQFHWWDYSNPSYLDALKYLAELRESGKIRHLALTNFDTEHLRIITEMGIPIVSNQVQYSLIDMRPAARMAAYCEQHGITLLAYGTLGGGLLSAAWLGKPEPTSSQLATASLRKYKQMIDVWGGWRLFQQLLGTLHEIATQHEVSIANVAVAQMLAQPAVAGVIVGARLGIREHITDTARVFQVQLTNDDTARIAAVQQQGSDLLRLIGDCGDEYRR